MISNFLFFFLSLPLISNIVLLRKLPVISLILNQSFNLYVYVVLTTLMFNHMPGFWYVKSYQLCITMTSLIFIITGLIGVLRITSRRKQTSCWTPLTPATRRCFRVRWACLIPPHPSPFKAHKVNKVGDKEWWLVRQKSQNWDLYRVIGLFNICMGDDEGKAHHILLAIWIKLDKY